MNNYLNRNSNLELLRIIAIVMVLFLHSFGIVNNMLNEFNSLVSIIINSICNMGVTLFILISGYFGIEFKVKKMAKLHVKVLSLSIIILLIQIAFNMPLSREDIIKSFLPIISCKYWFLSCYFFLMILSPYINSFIKNLNKKMYTNLLIITITLFSIIPTFFYFELTKDSGKGLINMILIYIIGRYIAIYFENSSINVKNILILLTLLLTLGTILNIIIYKVTGRMINLFARDNSILIIIPAIMLFLIFKQLNLKSMIINKISLHVLPVYVIHIPILSYLSEEIFDIKKFAGEVYLIFFIIIIVFLVFTSCIIIDLVRIKMLNKLENKFIILEIRIIKKIKAYLNFDNLKDNKFNRLIRLDN